MRDQERSLQKERGVYRIVCLGDSHTFGWGVEQEETYPARLEEMLAKKYTGKAFEVLNHGVPGYNTVQEVASFAEKIDDLDPDMVIINYVNNDMDLPNFLADRPDPLTLRRSYLTELLRRRLAILRGGKILPSGLTHAGQDERSLHFRPPVEDIPEKFRTLYGWDNMVDAFRRLAGICRERDIHCLVLFNMDDYSPRLAGKTPTVMPRFVRELAEMCRKKGYLVADPQERVFRYLQENVLDTTAVWISETDSHTNPIRHGFIAEEILAVTEEAGLLR
jgi:lysophospholipase L1-like esterase